MINKAFVNICQPVDRIKAECNKLEEQGFVSTGQIGGGEDDSCIVYEHYEDATEYEQCDIWNRHLKHKKMCEEYFNKVIKE